MQKENTPTLYTKRLLLRKFTPDDTQALLQMLRDAEMNTFLPWFPLKNTAEAEAFLEKNFLSYYSLPSAYRYAICKKEENIPIGYVVLANDDSCDFGYGLTPKFWCQGLVSEAAEAVAARIKNAGYPYITATHDVNNPASGRVMQKIGMTYRYSYIEQWQPKDIPVTFRMYQINFDGSDYTYPKYWNQYSRHFIEETITHS